MLGRILPIRLALNLRTVLLLAVIPLIVAALYILITTLCGLPALRYDPAYFSEAYRRRYDTPNAVVTALEDALRRGDRALLAELQGLRHPWDFPTSPNVRATILYEATDRYLSYLFWDTRTYDRFPYHVEKVNGRWVVAPQDAQYYLYSGRWSGTWLPLALIWWVMELTALIANLIYRIARRWRRETLAY